jgi:uncharacterized protein YbbK (DUF523 family)
MSVNVQIAVSACLLGQPVRYDGTDKKHDRLKETLQIIDSANLELIPFCPEMGIGLGTPRPTIQLVQQKDATIRVLGVKDHTLDVTDAIESHARTFLTNYPDIHFLIVKARSPSCGYQTTPVHVQRNTKMVPMALDSGLFVKTLLVLKPELEIVDESTFDSGQGCLSWLQRVNRFYGK